jgi:hypothetical protein
MIDDIFVSPMIRFFTGLKLPQRFILPAFAKSQESANMLYTGSPWQVRSREE